MLFAFNVEVASGEGKVIVDDHDAFSAAERIKQAGYTILDRGGPYKGNMMLITADDDYPLVAEVK